MLFPSVSIRAWRLAKAHENCFERRQNRFGSAPDDYSVIIRSAHSTSETKMAGLPNFAPQLLRSVSVTPRAREHDPQEKTGMRFARIFSRVSLRGGQPTGMIWSAVAFRIKYVASPVRKICTSWPASTSASPCRNGNDALVGSSDPHALFIMTLSFLEGTCT